MKLGCIFLIVLAGNFFQTSANTNPIADAFASLIKELSAEIQPKNLENGVINKPDRPDSINSRNHHQVASITDFVEIAPPLVPPKVQTNSGLLTGEINEHSQAFYSVPYAAPPTGNRRYMAPEPVEDKSDKDVSVPDYRNCWQILSCEPNCTAADGNLTEDCLVVTIDVPKKVDLSDPSNPPTDRLPVMFWIHGGFFLFGSGTSYKLDGRKLSQEANAIVVRVNYRLGPLGFLSFQDENTFIDGNQGLKDQQFALEWVQNNIENFGGDKNRVTLFGNSAGSQSIIFHLLSSTSDPFFQRGIIQSSPTVFSYQTPKESSQTITKRYLEALNCNEDTSCLRELPVELLIESSRKVMALSLRDGDFFGGIEPFRPVIDGTEYKAQPLTLFKNGLWQTHKEVIIGTNQEEMSYVDSVLEGTGLPFPKRLFELINNVVLGEPYGSIMTEYYDNNQRLDVYYGDNLAEEVTDMFFVCPNRALARFAAATSTHPQKSVYLYNMAYPLSTEFCQVMQSYPPVCGTSHHSSEIVLVFKTDYVYRANFSAEDALVSDMFTSYWSEFASSGNSSSGSQFTPWPAYTGESTSPWRNIILQYDQSQVDTDYKKEICDLWDESGYYFETADTSSTTTDIHTSSDTEAATSSILTTARTTTEDFGEIDTTTCGAESLTKPPVVMLLCIFLASFWATLLY